MAATAVDELRLLKMPLETTLIAGFAKITEISRALKIEDWMLPGLNP
jgi:hypothetical protein